MIPPLAWDQWQGSACRSVSFLGSREEPGLGGLSANGLTWPGGRVVPWAPDIQDRTR